MADSDSETIADSSSATMAASDSKKKQKILSLHKATIRKVVKEMLPPGLSLDNDVEDILLETSTEFIRMVTFQANEIRIKDRAALLHPKHVMQAMEELEFGEYRDVLEKTYEDLKTRRAKERAEGKRGEPKGMTEEEAVATQKRLFAEARERMNNRNRESGGVAPSEPQTDGQAQDTPTSEAQGRILRAVQFYLTSDE